MLEAEDFAVEECDGKADGGKIHAPFHRKIELQLRLDVFRQFVFSNSTERHDIFRRQAFCVFTIQGDDARRIFQSVGIVTDAQFHFPTEVVSIAIFRNAHGLDGFHSAEYRRGSYGGFSQSIQLEREGLKFFFVAIDRIAVHRGSENQVSLFAQFHVIILFFRLVFHAAGDHRHAIGRSFRYNPRDGVVMIFDDEAKIPRDLRQGVAVEGTNGLCRLVVVVARGQAIQAKTAEQK